MTRDEMLEAFPYMKWYEKVNFRHHPELYRTGRGEQGVLMAEPYKSEILPHWKFRTPNVARQSAEKIEAMFHEYLEQQDFPGADMARKYLMMGWTRSRRYANHPSGRKYDKLSHVILPLADDYLTSEKAQSAVIFKDAYDRVRTDPKYLKLKAAHIKRYRPK